MSLNQNNRVPADKGWTEPEKWIWEQASIGQIADFNLKYQKLDPTVKESWTEERSVSPGFIETVLLQDTYRASLPRRGLRISGAWIKEKLDLNNARLETEWSIENSRFDGLVDLSFLQTTNLISFGESVFKESIDLTYAQIGTILDLNKTQFQKITMIGAKIGGQLNMSGTKVKDVLDMDSLSVGSSLFMSGKSEFQEIDLRGAKITCHLDMTDSKVKGKLCLDSLEVINHLRMSKSEFNDIDLRNSKIGGLIDLNDTKVRGKLDMSQLLLGSSLFMSEKSEFQEIVLRGAKVTGQLDLTNSKVKGKLCLDTLEVIIHLRMSKSEFNDIDLRNSKIGGLIDLNDTKVRGKLDMNQLSVGGSLFITQKSEFQEIVLRGAKIIGHLIMTNSKVEGKAHMDSISVGEYIQMTGSQFQDINLQSAKIGGQLDIAGIKVKEKLEMSSISIGSHLFMNETEIQDINLIAANVRGQLNTTDATVPGTLEMDSVSVDQNIFLYPKRIGQVNLKAASIGQSVYISRSDISTLDFSGAYIRGELHVGMFPANGMWPQNSILHLRNTQVGAIDDGGNENSWPDKLNLEGFTYSRLGGLLDKNNVDQTRSIKDQSAQWFISWLAKEENYSPQPYGQLASVLLVMGHSKMANTILHASKNRERKEAWTSRKMMKWFGYSLLNWTIGYGFGARYFRSLIWVLGLALIGAYVLYTTQISGLPSFWDKISFSLDMLLPIIELNDKYKLDSLVGWQLYYFYFHELMGFLLGSFVVAGLSGITKK